MLLNYEYPPVGGGGGVASSQIAKGLSQHDISIDVVTGGFGKLYKEDTISGIRVFRVKVLFRNKLATASFISMLTYLVSGFVKSLSLIKKEKYCLIYSHFAVPTGLLGTVLSKMFHKRHALSIYGGDIYDPSKKTSPHRHFVTRKLVQWVLNNSEVIISDSEETSQKAREYYSVKKNIHVVPIPYEAKSFKKISRKKLGLDSKSKYLISIGRLVPRKGYSELIRTFKFIKDRNIKLLIIGEGPERKKLEKLIMQYKLIKRIFLLGQKPEEEKYQYLYRSDAYILPSLHEGFGIVIQEALQAGLPVFTTKDVGILTYLKQKENYIFIDISKTEEAAKIIINNLGKNRLLKVISRNNMRVVRKFSFDHLIPSYMQLLK